MIVKSVQRTVTYLINILIGSADEVHGADAGQRLFDQLETVRLAEQTFVDNVQVGVAQVDDSFRSNFFVVLIEVERLIFRVEYEKSQLPLLFLFALLEKKAGHLLL